MRSQLMGKESESADAIIARNSDIFVADTLSQQNKNQCEQLGVKWVALRDKEGYKRFGKALKELNIPHTEFTDNLDTHLDKIVSEIFDE